MDIAPIPSQGLQAKGPSPAGYDGAMSSSPIGTLTGGVNASSGGLG